MRQFFTFIFVFLYGLASFDALASGLPDLGDAGADDFSLAQERQLGEEIMREVRRDPAWLDDPLVEEYINRLGQRLVAASAEPGRAFEFFVVKDPMLNAFALPGGYIGVHTGLILAAQSESELAGVLGHEIGHVTQHHIAQMVGKQKQMTMMMLASLLAAVAAGGSRASEAAIMAGAAGTSQAQLGYSRDFEREADRIGLQTLEAAGFDVRGMAGFFERLQRASRLYENNAPVYLRTHPLTTERISDMENRVMNMPYRQVLDSPDFSYVRVRLRVQSLPAAEAVQAFAGLVAGSPNDTVLRYGLALAQLRFGRLEDAKHIFDDLRRTAKPSPFIAILSGEMAMARRDTDAAINAFSAACKAFPESMSAAYALADAQITGGRAQDAERNVRRALASRSSDMRLWGLLARANGALGKHTAQHRAQAEVYALQGDYRATVEQLELARRSKDGDFYELSAVEARLHEIRARMDEGKRSGQRKSER
ncbi:MAG: M48 family metalloprotease [Betaproteobacteria bacterium]|nr:M48 family metalloprotease [Betaproteobacteria bacterium]